MADSKVVQLTRAHVVFEGIIFRSNLLQKPRESILLHRGIRDLLVLGLLRLNTGLHSVIVKHTVSKEGVGYVTTIGIQPIVTCFSVWVAQFQIFAGLGREKSGSIGLHFVFQSVFHLLQIVEDSILFLLFDLFRSVIAVTSEFSESSGRQWDWFSV